MFSQYWWVPLILVWSAVQGYLSKKVYDTGLLDTKFLDVICDECNRDMALGM